MVKWMKLWKNKYMDKIVHISSSFEEAEEWDIQQELSMTSEERLDLLQRLREEYYTFTNENRKGFQRVYRIVKLGES
jgi:hypothetical protein